LCTSTTPLLESNVTIPDLLVFLLVRPNTHFNNCRCRKCFLQSLYLLPTGSFTIAKVPGQRLLRPTAFLLHPQWNKESGVFQGVDTRLEAFLDNPIHVEILDNLITCSDNTLAHGFLWFFPRFLSKSRWCCFFLRFYCLSEISAQLNISLLDIGMNRTQPSFN
jgi:hypothetical protein